MIHRLLLLFAAKFLDDANVWFWAVIARILSMTCWLGKTELWWNWSLLVGGCRSSTSLTQIQRASSLAGKPLERPMSRRNFTCTSSASESQTKFKPQMSGCCFLWLKVVCFSTLLTLDVRVLNSLLPTEVCWVDGYILDYGSRLGRGIDLHQGRCLQEQQDLDGSWLTVSGSSPWLLSTASLSAGTGTSATCCLAGWWCQMCPWFWSSCDVKLPAMCWNRQLPVRVWHAGQLHVRWWDRILFSCTH